MTPRAGQAPNDNDMAYQYGTSRLLHPLAGGAKVGPEIDWAWPGHEGSGMPENDEFVQSKHAQYAVFTRLVFWLLIGTFLTLAALAVIFF